jgi:DNA polymerase-3 subunit epsilon
VFVAHNARFDYGFLKHAFWREGQSFTARVLCTVKLSRRLFPEAGHHNLDSVIARHSLPIDGRHRALGDARVLWAFVQALYRDLPEAAIAEAAKRVLRLPSLPPQLDAERWTRCRKRPVSTRSTASRATAVHRQEPHRASAWAHFSSDYRSATDSRLSAEIRRIEFEETAGEIGALLRESALVKSLLPAHNHALRRKSESGVLELPAAPGPPRYVAAAGVEPGALAGRFGPFSSKRSAREALRSLAAEHALCWKALGLEKRQGPCFARQVKRCAGVCVGAESPEAHHARLAEALAAHAIRHGRSRLAALRERRPCPACRCPRLRDWCWLGTARRGELGA